MKSVPIQSPLYPSLEYNADVKAITAICEADKAYVKMYLADTPFNYYTNKIIIEGGEYKNCTIGDFNFTGLIIPVEFQGKFGGYYAYSHCSTDASVALGREPFGYPKKQAEVIYQSEENSINVTSTRNNIKFIDMKAEVNNEEVNAPLVKGSPHFLHQLIPEVDGSTYILNRVVSRDASQSPTKVVKQKMADITINFAESEDDPLYLFNIQEVLQGFYSETTFHSAYGKVLKDIKSSTN